LARGPAAAHDRDPAEALAFIEANQPTEAVELLSAEPDEVLRFMRNERARAR
jgi:hypothetical protein